jgi:hypothetical protein
MMDNRSREYVAVPLFLMHYGMIVHIEDYPQG